MNSHRTQYYGIWLDDNKALIISLDSNKTLIMPVFKAIGNSSKKSSNLESITGSSFESSYFKDITSALPKSETLLILGPDQSKFHLKEFLEKETGAFKYLITKVASHMSTSDVVYTVRSFFLKDRQEFV